MTRQTQLTVKAILNGTGFGQVQSVGHMEVVPILDGGDASDASFAPPEFTVGTSDYGTVRVSNDSPDRPTILPTGAGWVTKQHAQDHAVPSAHLMKAGENKTIDRARCIESSQGGYIRDAKDMLILPASLRTPALTGRHSKGYDLLWNDITRFNTSLGVEDSGGHLVMFLKKYETELDQFVAEFELVPNQLGAVILIGGQVVGVERAPNVDFWNRLWTPLVRVCYGSLALKARVKLGDTPPPTRSPMVVEEKSLAGIAAALKTARTQSTALIEAAVDSVKAAPLLFAGEADDKLTGMELVTVANSRLAGQLVLTDGRMPYVSLCAAGA